MNEKVEVLSDDKNSYKKIEKKEDDDEDGIEMEYKFKVVIGTLSSFTSNYDVKNPCNSKISIIKQLSIFYTRQLDKDEGNADAVKQALANKDHLHIIIIGRLISKQIGRAHV